MPTFDLGPNLKIHFQEINKTGSPVVLLLHGLGAMGESWGFQVPALEAANFSVLIPDLRGFGKSSYPGGTSSIQSMSNDVVKLLDFLQIPKINLAGISMGGTVALQFALDHPDRVHKLVLINTFAHLNPDSFKGWLYFLIRTVLLYTLGINKQANVVAKRIFPDPKQAEFRQILISQINQADPHGYRAAMWALARFNVKQRLNELSIPTLVITGENDTTVPPKIQKDLAGGIPNSQQTIIPAAGHAVIVDQTETFNKIFIDFLIDHS